MATIFDDNFPDDEPFEVRLSEKHDPDRPGTSIYSGVMESPLLNMYEMLLVICMLVKSNNEIEIDAVNTVKISINRLREITKMSKKNICKDIKTLEKKGVLIKEKDVSPNDGNIENTYKILNYISVWDSATLKELKEKTDEIKREMSLHML